MNDGGLESCVGRATSHRAADPRPVIVPTLIITGTCGAGKSTIAAEINDVLGESKVANAAIDLDALTWLSPPTSAFNNELMFKNLAVLWPNYQAHGARRLVLARVVEDRAELDLYRAAIPGAEITVCRLVTSQALRLHRLRTRMPPGPARDWHERRSVELEEILEGAAVEDFAIANEDRSAREVALEALHRSGWLEKR